MYATSINPEVSAYFLSPKLLDVWNGEWQLQGYWLNKIIIKIAELKIRG